MVDVRDVLHRVNAARVGCGYLPLSDLRRGNSSPNSCPLANSLKDAIPGARVDGTYLSNVPRGRAGAVAAALGGSVESVNGTASVRLPASLSQFVREFDSGRSYLLKYKGF